MLKTLFNLGFFSNKVCHISSASVDKNSGWTLFEIMIVSVLTSIFASMAIPNMMEGIEKNKAQSALSQVKGALFEAQRNSIKMGKECKLSMNFATNNGSPDPYLSIYDDGSDPSPYLGCLSSEKVILKGLVVTENFPGSTIRFSYRGNTTNIGTIVVESPNARKKYCLVISNFLGIMRSGVYSGTTTDGASISATNCQSSF